MSTPSGIVQAGKSEEPSLLRAKTLVWITGLLSALSLASYLASRITQLNQTIDLLDGDHNLPAQGTPVVSAEVMTWTQASLLAIPVCFALYLVSLAFYFLAARKRRKGNSRQL